MATLAEFTRAECMTLIGLPLPLTIRPAGPLSEEALMAFSQMNRPLQIERNSAGELEIMSPAGSEGSLWEALVIGELATWARIHGGVSFSSSGGFTLPDGSVRSPDAAWISNERWDGLTKAERSGYAPLCPDFVIEILSASDRRPALESKMYSWIRNGARLAWLIDPYAATVTLYRADGSTEVLISPEFVEAGEPVAGFRLSTSSLWSE